MTNRFYLLSVNNKYRRAAVLNEIKTNSKEDKERIDVGNSSSLQYFTHFQLTACLTGESLLVLSYEYKIARGGRTFNVYFQLLRGNVNPAFFCKDHVNGPVKILTLKDLRVTYFLLKILLIIHCAFSMWKMNREWLFANLEDPRKAPCEVFANCFQLSHEFW